MYYLILSPKELLPLITPIAQTLVATSVAVLSYIAWSTGKKRARAEFARALADQWNALNVLALKDDDLTFVAEGIFNLGSESEDASAKKSGWMGFMALNTLQIVYLASSDGVIDAAYARQLYEDVLALLVSQDDLFGLSQTRGYHPEFSRLCANERHRFLQRQVRK
jgi:hypothetical protein